MSDIRRGRGKYHDFQGPDEVKVTPELKAKNVVFTRLDALSSLSPPRSLTMTADYQDLARVLRARAAKRLDTEELSDEAKDDAELINVLARVLEGKPLEKAFGAPGDWGYGNAIGDALAAAYRHPAAPPGVDLAAAAAGTLADVCECQTPGCPGVGLAGNKCPGCGKLFFPF